MPEFYCDICFAPMVLDHKFETKKRGDKKKVYRIRRFKCTQCDFKSTKFAAGQMDDKTIPEKGVEVSKAIARKESENRET